MTFSIDQDPILVIGSENLRSKLPCSQFLKKMNKDSAVEARVELGNNFCSFF